MRLVVLFEVIFGGRGEGGGGKDNYLVKGLCASVIQLCAEYNGVRCLL